MSLHLADATRFLVDYARKCEPKVNDPYDVCVYDLLRNYHSSRGHNPDTMANAVTEDLSSVFLDAAWHLCQRGVLRPGIRTANTGQSPSGPIGAGYSITSAGRMWLAQGAENAFVPSEPGRLWELLRPHVERFGPGFGQRAHEAIHCYEADAYIACCAMCGAAAESVLLRTAVDQAPEKAELTQREYGAFGGRAKIINRVVGQTKGDVRQKIEELMRLLNYWRDESAHGKASTIDNSEAHIALAMLLQLTTVITSNWDTLMTR